RPIRSFSDRFPLVLSANRSHSRRLDQIVNYFLKKVPAGRIALREKRRTPSMLDGPAQERRFGILEGLLASGVGSDREDLVDHRDTLADLIAGPGHGRG